MKTAVEWLLEEINQQQNIYIDLGKKNKTLKKQVDAILTATTLLKMKCEQAKEIEKEQLKQCYHFAQVEQQKEFSSIYVGMSFEKWYNEIYKNE